MGLFKKKKEEVLVVPRTKLFGDDRERFFQGFMPKKGTSFEDVIIENNQYLLRKHTSEEQKIPAENDENFKQIIPYAILRKKDKFFVYKRTKKGNEERLHEKFSLGVGGHINPLSMRRMNKLIRKGSELSIIDHGMITELEEEIKHKEEKLNYKIIGYINHDGNEVGRVHFGIVYLIDLSDDIEIREKHKLEGTMMTKEEIAKIKDKFEEWSQFAWTHLLINY
ncbi:MAG: hypothetical protein ACLFPQ_03635 [Candidatus Woesearchaeota archaeon]